MADRWDELERLNVAATPGPLVLFHCGDGIYDLLPAGRPGDFALSMTEANARYVEALYRAAPALLAAAREGERLRVLARRAHALLRIPDRSVWQYASASTEHAHVLEQLERAALAGKGEG